MNIAKRVGENIKQARRSVGMTQKEVAIKLGMTQQQYSRFENGVFELDYMRILELCELYSITPNDIFAMN